MDILFSCRFIAFIEDVLSMKSNDYSLDGQPITKIIFNFFWLIKNARIADNKWQDLNRNFALSKEVVLLKLGNFKIKLPSNMQYASWGTTVSESYTNLIVRLENIEQQNVILVWDKVENKLTLSGFPFTFCDSLTPDGLLKRSFSDGTVFYIKSGHVVLKTKLIKTEFMKKLDVVKPLKPFNAATLDIETVVQNGRHVPYLFSFFDGVKSYSFCESDAKGLFKTMLMSKYRGKTVYAHNLSRFDVVFLFKEIGRLQNAGYKVTILNKDDKIISINIVRGKNTCLVIKDSLLLLPASLEMLAKQFNLKVGREAVLNQYISVQDTLNINLLI